MSEVRTHGRGRMCFCYARPEGFSGQKEAAELVLRGLSGRGWVCDELHQPVLDRTRGVRELIRYLRAMVTTWWRAVVVLRGNNGYLWVGLGQTRTSFIRDAVPLLVGRLSLGRERLIVSLNGSLFMHWPVRSWDARAFRWMMGHAGTVTVVGERQREHLIGRLGLSPERASVVVNTCTLTPLTASQVQAKHAGSGQIVRCLYLSSLIDTKGFPEYLEALRKLTRLPGPRIEAVLCGALVTTQFAARFADAAEAERWIQLQMAEINWSDRVSVRWIKGARGEAKATLFEQADIFVLPTYYAVEAQPLVLLEAMATGCAIVTTAVAEIATILDVDSAEFVTPASSEALAHTLQELVAQPARRASLAGAAHARFMNCYQVERHLDRWEGMLHRPSPEGQS